MKIFKKNQNKHLNIFCKKFVHSVTLVNNPQPLNVIDYGIFLLVLISYYTFPPNTPLC